MPRPRKPQNVRGLRRQLKRDTQNLQAAITYKQQEVKMLENRVAALTKQLNDKQDHLLPQKQALLKELSFLVNATSRAVRTTMWSLKPPSQRGW